MLAALGRDLRPNAVKVVVLVTDEPALGPPALHAEVGRRLSSVEAVCFTIAPDCSYFREWARDHGGTWQPIGMTIDAAALTQVFEDAMRSAVMVADAVHTHHGGSVRRYLERAAAEPPNALGRAAPTHRLVTRRLPPPAIGPAPDRRRLTRYGDPGPKRLGPGRPT